MELFSFNSCSKYFLSFHNYTIHNKLLEKGTQTDIIIYVPLVTRDMPRAITIGISLTTVCYLMVNVAYITVLGASGILASEAVAVVSKKTQIPLEQVIECVCSDCNERGRGTSRFRAGKKSNIGRYSIKCGKYQTN